jgi:hypothetical protein
MQSSDHSKMSKMGQKCMMGEHCNTSSH